MRFSETDINSWCEGLLYSKPCLSFFVWLSNFELNCIGDPNEFELYWGAVFFLRSVHTFSSFLNSNCSSDFGHAEIGNVAKKRVVMRREIFRSNFKEE